MIKKNTPNFIKGRREYRPEIIVIHIVDGTAQSAIEEFSSASTQKSSHYLVDKEGEVYQFVDEKNQAFANGIIDKPTSKIVLDHKEVNPNLYSISIECEGKDKDIPEIQYKKVADLALDICERWLIPLDRQHIIGHNEIRKSKRCPLPISVDKIVKLTIAQKSLNEAKIKELQKVEVSLLQKIINYLKKYV